MIQGKSIIVGLAMSAVLMVATGRSAARYARAQDQYAAAQRVAQELSSLVEEIIRLRSQRQRIELQPRPAQDVISRVNEALSAIGLDQRHFKGLSPESDVEIPRSDNSMQGVRRQTLRLSLKSMAPLELGRLLHSWRQHNPTWRPTRIEMTHSGGSNSDENLFDVVILLAALYLDETE